jgi:hypothetical protein
MGESLSFIKIIEWIKNSEMFFNPVKVLPGRWQLFEFYTEPALELIHMEESQLKAENLFWNIEFSDDRVFSQKSNLNFPVIHSDLTGTWSRNGNYIIIKSTGEKYSYSIEFQFALDKEKLKLLKKDKLGKIEIFGFFRKIV